MGIALCGWGSAILLGAVPHEDPIVAAGLLAIGVALLVTAPRLPGVALPSWTLASAGILLCCVLAAAMAWLGARPDVPKLALFLVGLALVALAPLASRSFQWRGEPVPASSLGLALAAALAAPLLAWAAQAAFKTSVGATPTEAFVAHALVTPLSWALTLAGWTPVADGQSITYAGVAGPLRVNVGAACSGIQAMAVFGGVLAIFLVTQRPPGRTMALWSAIGLFGVYVANLVRLVALAVVGHYGGVDALLQAHAQAGWVVFVAWAVLFAWLIRRRSPASVGRRDVVEATPSSSPDSADL